MAPEVIKGECYNKKVDIWAFGCIIFELFTLNVCFESKSLYGYVDKIVNKYHGKINLEKYNKRWQDLIDLLLEKNYHKRPDIEKVYELIININNKMRRIYESEIRRVNENQIKIMKSKVILFNKYFQSIVFVVGDSNIGKTSFIER